MRRFTIAVGVVLLLLSAVAPAAGLGGVQPAATDAANSAQELECSFPFEATDESGHDVTVEEEPERVVTLNPSAAQTMWEIGGQTKVVGVSQFADFLDGAESREVVTSGYPSTVNVEKVISLEPDLVLAPNTIDNESVNQLRDADITVYRFEMAASIESIYEKTELVGMLTGECDGAQATVSEMRNRVQTVEESVSGQDEPSVLYDMGDRYSAGPNTFIGHVIDTAGGDNVVANANTTNPYPQLSAEFIVEQDPEFVVVSVSPEQLGNDSRSYISEDSVLRNTTAWDEGNIVVVDTNEISQPAPRVVNPMTKLASSFHADAYAEANTTTTSTTDASTTDASTTAATDEPTTAADDDGTDTGTPGFGIATALVAVLCAGLVARR